MERGSGIHGAPKAVARDIVLKNPALLAGLLFAPDGQRDLASLAFGE
jgi:hypothetical protein